MLNKNHRTNVHKQDGLVRQSRLMKLLTFFIILIIISTILLLTTRLTNITFEGNTHYSDEEMKELLTSEETDSNTLLFYLRYKFGDKKQIPFIEKVDVELISKNEVNVKVYEKVVSGAIYYMGTYMYFDREGIIVEVANEKVDYVPVISGLKFNRLVLHEPIEVDKDNVFQTILDLTQLIQTHSVDINTIFFTNDLEVVLYYDKIRILLGKRDSYSEQIAQIPNLLASIEADKDKLNYDSDNRLVIDMKDFKEGQDKIIAIPIE